MRGPDALARLLRPDRSPVLRLLQDAPLTVEDVLAVRPRRPAGDRTAARRRPVPVPDESTPSEER